MADAAAEGRYGAGRCSSWHGEEGADACAYLRCWRAGAFGMGLAGRAGGGRGVQRVRHQPHKQTRAALPVTRPPARGFRPALHLAGDKCSYVHAHRSLTLMHARDGRLALAAASERVSRHATCCCLLVSHGCHHIYGSWYALTTDKYNGGPDAQQTVLQKVKLVQVPVRRRCTVRSAAGCM